MQVDGVVYQQIVETQMDTSCAPFIAVLYLYCNEEDIMSHLHKSKWCDLLDLL